MLYTFSSPIVDKISHPCYYGANKSRKEHKNMEKIKIKLFSDAFFSYGMYRLPDENGNDSEFYMEDEWLEAHAFDDKDQEYMVFWDILPGWDGETNEGICDWDHPTAIITFAPNGKSYDMTGKVIIVEDKK